MKINVFFCKIAIDCKFWSMPILSDHEKVAITLLCGTFPQI